MDIFLNYAFLINNILFYRSINNASIVDLDLKMWTKDIHKNFTLFLPDDHHLVSMPVYGQKKLFSDWYLIRKVSVLFILFI